MKETDLKSMSIDERLQMMESIWASFNHEAAAIESPDWHGMSWLREKPSWKAGKQSSFRLKHLRPITLQRISNIVVLEEAADDLVAGRDFYDQQEPGVGQYFWDSLISDIESLTIYAGVHQRYFGLFRLLSKRFSYAVIMR